MELIKSQESLKEAMTNKDHERHLGFDTPPSDLGMGPSLNSHQELPLNLTTFIGICFTLTACLEIK